jgi:R.HinP1I restriction endonuclease
MGYRLESIEQIDAICIPTIISKKRLIEFNIQENDYEEFTRFKKADAQVRLIIKLADIIKIENLSLKKANVSAGFNQIDKRPIETYKSFWGFSDEVAFWLKLFTGELDYKKYTDKLDQKEFRNEKRLFLDELPLEAVHNIIGFFEANKILIISDIIKGRGGLSADWLLVTKLDKPNNETSWVLKEINQVMNFYGTGDIKISPRGSLKIGKITMQRKGGTPDPTSLQFKFNPNAIFDLI